MILEEGALVIFKDMSNGGVVTLGVSPYKQENQPGYHVIQPGQTSTTTYVPSQNIIRVL